MNSKVLHVGQHIKEYLSDNGIKQVHLSEKIGMSRQGLAHLLSRESIDLKMLQKIGRALNHDFLADLSGGKQTTDFNEPSQVAEDSEEYGKSGKQVYVFTFEDGELVDIQRDMREKGETVHERLERLEAAIKTVIENQVRNMG